MTADNNYNDCVCIFMNEERDSSKAEEPTVDNTKSSASNSPSTTV